MSVLALDIGASHVDLALHDGAAIRVHKHPRAGLGLAKAALAALDAAGFSPADITELRLATTEPLNALLRGTLARVALVTTEGFADTLALGRQNRASLYDPVARHPGFGGLVGAGDIHTLGGRIGADGREVLALDNMALETLAARLAADPPEAVAVCLLFAHLDPEHESRVAEALARALPGVPVCLSHAVDPAPREYERMLATCVEAALAPALSEGIAALEAGLTARGCSGRLLLACGAGQLRGVREMAGRLAEMLDSGPAAAAAHAARLAPEALMLDMGETSLDLALVSGGAPVQTRWRNFAGVALRRPGIDGSSMALGGASRPLGPSGPRLDAALACLFPDAVPAATLPPGTHLPDQRQARAAADTAADIAARAALDFAMRRNADPARLSLVALGGLGPALAPMIATRLGSKMQAASPAPAFGGALGLLALRGGTRVRVRVEVASTSLDGAALDHLHRELGLPGPSASYTAELAPTAHMHPATLDLPGWPADGTGLEQAHARYSLERFGLTRSGPVHVFALEATVQAPALADVALAGATARAVPQGAGPSSAAARPEIVQMRLDGIAQAMQDVLFRTAVSPVVREGADAASALFAPDGTLLAMSEAIPLLLGALPGAVQAILARYPSAGMSAGDAYVMNDPFAGGTHLPDLVVLCPVLVEGQLAAFAASILHHQDVGGMRAGSVPPDAVEIHQEGLRLPPMPLARGGAFLPEIEALIRANSRAPDTVMGDLSAQLAAAARAGSAIARLVGETGAGAFAEACGANLARAEAATRAALACLGPGPHRGSDGLDPTPGLPEVSVRVALSVGPDGSLAADFADTSAQVAAPINCVASGPLSAVLYGMLTLLPDDVPRNGGVLRALALALPEGAVINARPPAAVNARMGLVRVTTSAVLEALARAAPGRRPAANSGMSFVIAFSGARSGGAPFLVTEIVAGGAGGGPDGPGADGISTDVGNAMNMPAEALEAMAPLRVLKAEIRRGSGGAGLHRGGDGIRRIYEALEDDIRVSVRGDRFQRVPDGALGGGAPLPAAARVERADGSVEHLPARSTPVLRRGDRLVVESAGGAGFRQAEG